MALKALMLRKKITDAKAKLDALRAKTAEFEQREKDLETSIGEAQTEEETAAVEAATEAFETEKAEHEKEVKDLEDEVQQLEDELRSVETANAPAPAPQEKMNERKDHKAMPTTLRYAEMSFEQRSAIVERDDVKDFLTRARTLAAEKRAVSGADILIPEVIIDLIRHEVAHQSKLLRFVRVVNVKGEARQNIAGAIPEAVWTEMCAKLNELSIAFNQVVVDGYKVGGYIAICNATLEDSDINLANEITTAIGGAIAKALDKAIIFGTGTKMPTGIVTRLAQTAQPESWETDAPAWTDLHTSHVLKLNIDTTSGAAFFGTLIEALAVAKPYYNSDGLFWVMNRKTHLHVLAKALAYNSAAALVSNTDIFPIIGGTVVEFEDDEIADNEIIGGFGGNYLLAERAGIKLASSDVVFFLQDQTVFKGTARYDGKPVAGEAFVIVNFANTDPTTTKSFPVDYANAEMNDLAVTAAQGGTSGKTVLTVSGAIGDSPTLKYKVGNFLDKLSVGDTATGYTDLTSGTTNIEAAAGKPITVVELDADSRVVSAGMAYSVPKA